MGLLKIMKQFFKRSNRTEPVVIFDVGSASIGGAVVLFNNEVPEMVFCTRKQIPFQEVADVSRLMPLIEEVLAQVVEEVQKGMQTDKLESTPKEIVCVLSSLWSNTQTTDASFENEKEFEVTDSIMNNLLAHIHKENKEQKGDAKEIIEEKVISSLLNGYPTMEPLGKRTNRISITFLEGVVDKDVHEKITNVINKVFSPDIPLLFRSFTLASFSVARDMFEKERDFLLLDVTGELTEMAVIRHSTIAKTLSFPYGRNTIIRNVATKNNSIPEDASSRIKLALLSEDTTTREILLEEEKKWIEMFGKACADLSSGMNPLPQSVFLVADSNHESWFRGMIERVDFSQFTTTKEAFEVTPLIDKQMEGACILGDKVVRDDFLIVDSLFYNREYLSR